MPWHAVLCRGTGLSLLCVMSDLCPYMRCFSVVDVSPTYCLLHLLHCSVYMTLDVLQVMLPLTGCVLPVCAEVTLSVLGMILQFWQTDALHGFEPFCGGMWLLSDGFMSLDMSMSLRFLVLRKNTPGGSGTSFLQTGSDCRIG